MKDYLDYLDHLGFAVVQRAYNLKPIDRFLVEHRIERIEQLNIRSLMQLLEAYQGKVRATTLRLYRDTFVGLGRYLVRLGWTLQNPVASFPVPPPQPYRPYVFSAPELGRFFDFLPARVCEATDPVTGYRAFSLYTFYHLLYACGLRVSEAVRLSRADYNPQAATLFIQPSKFHKDRLLPVGRKVCANLNSLLTTPERRFPDSAEERIFLFLPQHRPYNRHWATAWFRKTLQRLGIYRGEVYHQGCCHGTPHLHELRRAFAVHRLIRWYQEGADVDAKLPLLAHLPGAWLFGIHQDVSDLDRATADPGRPSLRRSL